MFGCNSLDLYERFERKQGISSLFYLKCSTSSCRYNLDMTHTYNDMTRTWQIMKEINSNRFPKSMLMESHNNRIAEEFN